MTSNEHGHTDLDQPQEGPIHLPMLFDQYSRYRVCADLLTKLTQKDPSTIIEVGCGWECLLEQFLPDQNITFLDPLLADLPTPVPNRIGNDFFQADLQGSTFDYLISLDFLEHIPGEMRLPFLERAANLAKKGLIIACPCADMGDALETDIFINDSYKIITGQAYPWLAEHFEMGLPDGAWVIKTLESLGWQVHCQPHGHTPWLRDLLLPTLCLWDFEQTKEVAFDLSRTFNQTFAAHDGSTPSYRQIFIATPQDQAPPYFSTGTRATPPAILPEWDRFRNRILQECLRRFHLAENQAQEIKSLAQPLGAQLEELLAGFPDSLTSRIPTPACCQSDQPHIPTILEKLKTLSLIVTQESLELEAAKERSSRLESELQRIQSTKIFRFLKFICRST